MCGIFGFVGERVYAESIDLGAVIASARHRGPDDQGTFFGTRGSSDVACAMAHTRLSIIDVSSAGHQPMCSPDGRYVLVFNGEIYNFRTLRNELELAGERFTSLSDTEVVLKAFVAWGPQCVKRLRGMFAFGIWDRVDERLFVARDHLGIKPLYSARTGKGFAFSSEVRMLLDAGVVDRRMSSAGLASYLAFGSAQDPLTIIDGVLALLPGHYATWEKQRFSAERYWTVGADADVDDDLSFDGAVERIRPVLHEAVALQLVADVPLGVFLSGGVDSSAIVALAAAASSKPIETFTVTFDEAAFDEKRYAAEIAERFGCVHHEVHLSAARAVSEFDRYVAALDQPSADGVNTFFVAEAAREAGLSVALSGSGGDEVFAGYPNFRSFGRFLALGRIAGPIAPSLRRLFDRRAFGSASIRARKLGAVLDAGGDPLATYEALRSMFTPAQVNALYPEAVFAEHNKNGAEPEALNGSDSVGLYSRLELTHYLRNTLLRDADVMSMAHSLEVRVPLIDHELVSCLAAIPGRLKLGSTSKPLLTAACGTLPAEVGTRKKMGFTLPMDVWFRGPLRERITTILAQDGPFDGESVRSLWTSFLNGSRSVSWSRIWTIAALLEWSRTNDISPSH